MNQPPGRVAVVTGAARRIGACVATALARAGFDVAINYRSSHSEAGDLVTRLQSTGRRALCVQGDMARKEDADRLLRETLAAYGRADVLVANASVFYPTPIAQVDESAWHHIIDNNLAATFWPARAFGTHMQGGPGGCIVMIADVAAYRPWAGYAPYNAAKAGVVALMTTLAKELAPRVRVNAIAPGPMLFPEDYDQERREREIQRTLLKRPGNPNHIAQAVLSFIENDYITGALLPVDGGRGLA